MTTPTNQAQNIQLKPNDELILVVKREKLFSDQAWTGIKAVDCDEYLDLIQENQEFLPRSLMEEDPTYKQIIPYLVFEFKGQYFLMQRHKKASETRLQSKFSFGIGGHIRQEDLTTNSIYDWARREFEEEIEYHGNLTMKPIGVLNDDSNDVGKVHIGFVFLVQGDSADIHVKEELQSGELLSLEACKQYYDGMESWSQMVFDFLFDH
jgi:predicted NUDIX family phosphoesterase